MLDGNTTRLVNHLWRGGAWGYTWIAETKQSYWVPVGKPPMPKNGKFNVFWGVHPSARQKDTKQRTTINDIAVINCLFADLDAKSFGSPKPAALAHLQTLPLSPSVIVDSGGGYHGYWLLRDPFFIKTDADRERVRQAQRNWVAFTGGDDGAKDLARILRMPGTVNYKPDYAPNFPTVTICKVEFDRLYSLDQLEAASARVIETAPIAAPSPTRSGNGHGAYVEAAVRDELDKLAHTGEGARNNQLNECAFALGQFIGAGVLDRTQAESDLSQTAHSLGLGEYEILTTIRSGIEAGIRHPRIIPSNGNGNHQRIETPKSEDPAPSDVHIQSAQYVIRNGRICRWKQKREGDVIVDVPLPLCNFTAQITEEVAHDDGVDVTRLLTIEGKHADGSLLPAARVDASQFGGMRWVTPSWGTRAIVEAGQSAQDHLRAAVQYLSPNVTTRRVYVHTGWRELDSKMVFLTQSGAVGGASAAVELDKELERYSLPVQAVDVRAAMEASLRYLEIAPYSVTVPLWSAMFLAPIAPIIPPHFMLWVYGVTGTLKSTMTALALSHYGDFAEDDLILWSATANALEKYLFLAKDVPFVIDDFAPQSDQAAARKLEDTAGRLVRGVGNRSARARMKGDLSLRTLYRPRGLVISTGEQLPDGQSLMARLVTVELERGDVDLAKLTDAQDEREDYRHAMAGYIQWLAGQWKHLAEALPNSWRNLRTQARQEGQHLRLPESIASLYVGLDLGLTFATEVEAINTSKAEELRRAGWAALVRIAESQHSRLEEERPTRRFVTVLTELLAQGKVRLNSTDLPNEIGDNDLIGWYDSEYVYLLPSASYHRVAQFARDEGRHFGVKENALRKALDEEGLLKSDDGHFTARARIGGQQRRVLKLVRAEVEKISGGSIQKAVKSVTGA